MQDYIPCNRVASPTMVRTLDIKLETVSAELAVSLGFVRDLKMTKQPQLRADTLRVNPHLPQTLRATIISCHLRIESAVAKPWQVE